MSDKPIYPESPRVKMRKMQSKIMQQAARIKELEAALDKGVQWYNAFDELQATIISLCDVTVGEKPQDGLIEAVRNMAADNKRLKKLLPPESLNFGSPFEDKKMKLLLLLLDLFYWHVRDTNITKDEVNDE